MQDESPRFTTIEVDLGIVYAGHSAKVDRTQQYPTKKIWYGDSWTRELRNFVARRDDKTAQGAVVKKKKETAKETKEIALNGSLKDNV